MSISFKLAKSLKASPDRNVVIIIGAAGFIASAVTVDLARDHHIVAIDRREPAQPLYEAAPTARWAILDIRDKSRLSDTFGAALAAFGHIDFVLHFAAFYHLLHGLTGPMRLSFASEDHTPQQPAPSPL